MLSAISLSILSRFGRGGIVYIKDHLDHLISDVYKYVHEGD